MHVHACKMVRGGLYLGAIHLLPDAILSEGVVSVAGESLDV